MIVRTEDGRGRPSSALLRSLPANRDCPVRDGDGRTVYCVPSAGTGARTFLASHAFSPLRNHLRVVQLPGREDRAAESCLEDVHVMAGLIADAVVADACEDYALFGHSFGALVMLEVARILVRAGAPAPAVVALAACAPPHLSAFARFDEMTPTQIVEALADLGGLDLHGERGERLLPLVLPALAADSRASARYARTAERAAISSPVLAMCGSHDVAVTTHQAAGWGDYTDAGLVVTEYPGGHFFPLESDLPLRAVVEWQR
ncbi:MAG: alpha/beta fold hydrolase [Nocardioides sp.]|uniref:thioesterase II family protein n=1 Tax=Nocardioides sp. TaxID=35761 RepID=UPI00238B8CE7|nr:alpha/beta fold hydrolase [Nocardioides sp.]MDE0775683.1 alpha/beta fold hydrolase [Nocardioides sp.]